MPLRLRRQGRVAAVLKRCGALCGEVVTQTAAEEPKRAVLGLANGRGSLQQARRAPGTGPFRSSRTPLRWRRPPEQEGQR